MNSLTALFLLYEHIIPTQISNQNLLNILSMLPNCWIFSIRGVQQLFEAISTNCCRFALRSELQQHLLKYWNNEKKNLLQNSSLKKDPFGFRDLIVQLRIYLQTFRGAHLRHISGRHTSPVDSAGTSSPPTHLFWSSLPIRTQQSGRLLSSY